MADLSSKKMSNLNRRIIFTVLIIIWLVLHIPGLFYGTKDIPLHQSYVGDEQSPVNGALHIIEKKNILGLRNKNTVYYGPVFSIIAVPGILADFSLKYITGEVKTADDYKNHILWDWGGIIIFCRIIAILSSLLGLYFVYKICNTSTVNPQKSKYLAIFPVVLLATNFYYFEYSHFFKHWAFVITLLFIQIYSLIRIVETGNNQKKYWILHIVSTLLSFGISYVSIIFSLMWLPVIFKKWKEKDWLFFTKSLYSLLYLSMGIFIIYWWHPYAFNRLLGFIGIGESTGGLNNTQNPFALGDTSIGYYSKEIIFNHFTLILVLVISVFLVVKYRKIKEYYWVFVMSIPAVLNFLLFAPAEHHEGRYMMPTIAILVIFTGIIYARFVTSVILSTRFWRGVKYLVIILIIFYLLFHLVHIVKWAEIFNKGPAGEQIVDKILSEQVSEEKILIVNSYILGHAHTTEAYKDYMNVRGKNNVNLFNQLVSNKLPEGVIPINCYYKYTDNVESLTRSSEEYKHILLYKSQRDEINQFDFFDENLFRLWYYEDYSPKYLYIK